MVAARDHTFTDTYVLVDGVWVPRAQAGHFAYTDGDEVEQRLADLVGNAADVSLFSRDMVAAQQDWPSRYHFSATRANLLRPLEQALRGNTLEIGAGCGAITRFLGECGGNVVALEGSPRRARIAASRCRDLPNVKVVNDAFDRFQDDRRFSAITFIGVLEYARIYGEGSAPAESWLRKAAGLLEDDGVLVIAIENQLGLKYFAGLPEDHLAQSMAGINDQYGDDTATTYGRLELEGMLKAAGFGSVEFALPFPDYKLPVAVVLPEGYDPAETGFDATALARQTVSADAQLYHPPLFSLAQAWSVVGRNGLLADLSNSFLVVARKRGGAGYFSEELKDVLAFHYASERVAQFCKSNTFRRRENGSIEVDRKPLAPVSASPADGFFFADVQSEPYIRGVNHGDQLERLLTRRGWTLHEVVQWLEEWLQAFESRLAHDGAGFERQLSTMVPGWAVDALPRNLIVTPAGNYRFIDLEWRTRGTIEFGYVLYRAITVSLAPLAAVGVPADGTLLNVARMTQRLMLATGLLVTQGDLERYLQMDGVLREQAFGGREVFDFATFSTFTLKTLPEIPELVAGWNSSLDRLAADQEVLLREREEDRARFAQAEAKLRQLCDEVGLPAEAAPSSERALAQLRLLFLRHRDELRAFEDKQSSLTRDLERLRGREQSLVDEVDRLRDTSQRCGEEFGRLSHELELSRAEITRICNSKSWRLTRPLRHIRRVGLMASVRQATGRGVRRAYQSLPVSTAVRLRIKAGVFGAFGPLLKGTRSYVAWQQHDRQQRALQWSPVAGDELAPMPGAPVKVTVGDFAQQVFAGACAEPSSSYVPLDDSPADLAQLRARAIAFYLPQFHPIPENDAWWGRGFTEWTNVTKAVPQFVGHEQPHLPGELGFYDLRLVDVMHRQVQLAKHYGIEGFCFHYYWFGGRRLLERPLENFVADRSIDFPFCICWANENWTRRWDGFDQDLLIGQNHSPEDDLAFIEALSGLLRDPRYIRVGGRPLIVVYRPSLLPEAKATVARWREHCRRVGIGEIVLAMAQFDVEDPREFDFDAAIEFPPHKLAKGLEARNNELQILNPNYSGHVMAYGDIVKRAAQVDPVDYPMIRGVFPGWDNEARKPGRGYTFAFSTPEDYRNWLNLAIDYAQRHPVFGEKLVFINAWNEWAEGAYLEPDRKHGYAYLQATRDALGGHGGRVRGAPVLVVSHDAHPHGAQYLALHVAQDLSQVFGAEVSIALLGKGALEPRFAAVGPVHDLADSSTWPEAARAFARSGVCAAICNTTVTGKFARCLRDAGISVVSLVHELPGVITSQGLEEHALALVGASDTVVFPAEIVRNGFEKFAPPRPGQVRIRPQGCYKLNRWAFFSGRDEARTALRGRLGIPSAAKVVIGVGYADQRKGIDLFVAIGARVMAAHPDAHFVWVGHFDTTLEPRIRETVRATGLQDRFHFPGSTTDTDIYYAGADAYALTSREDPFPSVVMEALQVALPVIGFAGAGGFTELLEGGAGLVVPAFDTEAFGDAVIKLIENPEQARAMGEHGRMLINDRYSFRAYVFDLLEWMGYREPKVSVVIPNYNYAHYLRRRIDSVIDQTMPFYELIVLDDASTDNSLAEVEKLAIERRVHVRLVRNGKNSGSVFRQWAKGVELSRGDLVWIAEADDLAEPTFLETMQKATATPSVVMAYCQSTQMDESGGRIAENYLEYTNDISKKKWLDRYREKGLQEIRTCLAIKNTIPNVSAVLFRREPLRSVLERDLELMCQFRIAGDWVAYLGLLEQGDVAFIPDPLNHHRRHQVSVTLGGDKRSHMLEILRVQRLVRERYRPSEEVDRMASAYAESLHRYFGFDKEAVDELVKQLADAPPEGEDVLH